MDLEGARPSQPSLKIPRKHQATHKGRLDGEQHSPIPFARPKANRDPQSANESTTSISNTTRTVHSETIRHIDAQMSQMDAQLSALDDIVTRVRTKNSDHHAAHVESLGTLGTTVKQSYTSIASHLAASTDRTRAFSTDLDQRTAALAATLDPLQQDVHVPLADLRNDILATTLTEYVPTGATPQKTNYTYPRQLPRTGAHNVLLSNFRDQQAGVPPRHPQQPLAELPDLDENDDAPSAPPAHSSPSKAPVFTDADAASVDSALHGSPILTRAQLLSRPASSAGERGLRELDVNSVASSDQAMALPPSSKKANKGDGGTGAGSAAAVTQGLSQSIGPGSKLPKRAGVVAEGRENQVLSTGVGGGRGDGAGGRSLRSRAGS